MERLDPDALAAHLEVALAMAPPRVLANFKSADAYHPRATAELAGYLADRLAGLQLASGSDELRPEEQRLLFDGAF